MKKDIGPTGRKQFCSETARRIYDEMFGVKPKHKKPEQAEQPADDKPEPLINLEALITGNKKGGNGTGQPDNVAKVEEPKENTKEMPEVLKDIVNNVSSEKTEYRGPILRPDRRPPTVRDFLVEYFEKICENIDERKGSFKTLLSEIDNLPVNYVGPSSAGKTKMKMALRGLLPEDSYLEITTPDEFQEKLDAGEINGKVLSVPEFQIILRNSKNRKDILKLMINNEYKGAWIQFFVTSVATDDSYFKKYIATNKQLMRRLNIIYIGMPRSKYENIQSHEIEKNIEAAFMDESNKSTVEYFRDWVTYWRSFKLKRVSDPFSAFHSKYFVESPKAGDVLKRYHRLEKALLKMNLEESAYDVNGKKVQILSMREKYRIDSLREEVNQEIRKLDGDAVKILREEYSWPDEDIEKYFQSVERSKQDVDWQACWESGLESLRMLHGKALIPASVISEYINRHVVNGKVTVVDDYTGQVVVLAEHPPKQKARKDVIVVTNLEKMIDLGDEVSDVIEPEIIEPGTINIELPHNQQAIEPPYNQQAMPEHQNYARPITERKKLLCLPPGRGDENGQ